MMSELEGYELGHSQEVHYGDGRVFGIKILIKMTDRKLIEKDNEILYKAAEEIKRGIETVSAMVDLKGAEMRAARREEIEQIYRNAGISSIYMEPLPNGYCSLPCCLNRPWFRVTSSIGHIEIGWRKRVFSIDWKDTIIKETADNLFPDENTTKLETAIHAWGQDKAAQYIRTLHALPSP